MAATLPGENAPHLLHFLPPPPPKKSSLSTAKTDRYRQGIFLYHKSDTSGDKTGPQNQPHERGEPTRQSSVVGARAN